MMRDGQVEIIQSRDLKQLASQNSTESNSIESTSSLVS